MYIAGPYSAENARKVRLNVDKAIAIGCALIKKGWAVFVPHLTHYIWMHPDGDFSYDVWTELDMEWLKCAHGLFYISPSPGADKELEYAAKMGKPIYHALEQVPDLRGEEN